MELSGGVVEVDSGGDVADGSVDLKVRFHVLHQPGPVPGKTDQAGKVMEKLPTVLVKPVVRQE